MLSEPSLTRSGARRVIHPRVSQPQQVSNGGFMFVRYSKLTRTAVLALVVALLLPACRLGLKTGAPTTPSAPIGPSSGLPDFTYTFTASTTGPSGDSIQYQFDWGDGQKSLWSWSVPSGRSVTASHAWSATGTYPVTVRALNSQQQVMSDWSPAHSLIISTTRSD